MAALQCTVNDYLAEVYISQHKKLLVEGPDDNRLFNRLLDIFDKDRKKVNVDDASRIVGFDNTIGNREKVEIICMMVLKTHFSEKLVGFVDREFREFDWTPELKDRIGSHYVDGRLVWTRGHSIENYYFDFETLREPMSALSTTPYYQPALQLFEIYFEQTIRLACAASLVGLEIGNFQLIRNSISWELLEINNRALYINLDKYGTILRNRNVEEETVERILNGFMTWMIIMKQADYEIVRWLCHGHMGLSFIWASYKRMVYEASSIMGSSLPKSEVAHTLEPRDEVKFNVCAMKWIDRSLGYKSVFPFEVLKMLALKI